MKLRIRPSGISTYRVRVVRPASRADVCLALFFSMLAVTLGVVSFTLLCWKTGSDIGVLPDFPSLWGYLPQRRVLFGSAVLAAVFAKLIDAFASALNQRNSLKDLRADADELPASDLNPAWVLPE